jgi:hypothetical protein
MSPDERHLVILFASLSAICECWGTATVWYSYKRSASVGDSLRQEISNAKSVISDSNFQKFSGMLGVAAIFRNPFELIKVQRSNLDRLETLSAPLKSNFWITSGLIAYFVGAVFGLLAVFAAVGW